LSLLDISGVMINNHIPIRNTVLYSSTVNKMRNFFLDKGFSEVHTQDRLSILAACEDPETVAIYEYDGNIWPLPQTGQMWLEYELLNDPSLNGVFCVSTSYRNEPNPIPGRHETIFPMFEFEVKGTVDDLRLLCTDLCVHLGIGNKEDYAYKEYSDIAQKYKTKDLTSDHELRMEKEYGSVVFLENFPETSSPFWNMKRRGDKANKIDVIIYGQETIGSAERSSDKDEMREKFRTISNGKYAKLLYDKFGKDRVEKELNEFLLFDFFPRFGGGIGMTRMVRAMERQSSINI